jgi:glycosyltransferase involved in cell wall biosynthesis
MIGARSVVDESSGISVIVPVWNGERFLAEAFGTLVAQTLVPDEIIIVDDGSTDGTPAMLERIAAASSIPLHILHQNNQGPAAARNRGIEEARYPVLAFQDADDLWMPDKLRIQVPLLLAGADIVTGMTQRFEDFSSGRDSVSLSGAESGMAKVPGRPVGQAFPAYHFQNKLFRASLFRTVGLLDEGLRTGEDTDWMVRASRFGVKATLHPELVVLYRRHDSNLSDGGDPARGHLVDAIRRFRRG